MPRTFDGPIPARPERNDIPDKIGGFIDPIVGPRSHDAGANEGHPRMEDWFGVDRGDRTPVREAPERDAEARDFTFDPEGFVPRDGPHDLLKTVEFHNDWFFA